MKTSDTVFMSLKALICNPTRTLLTMLGIIIGIAAVITMMEIGQGSSRSIRESMEKMGAGSGLILPGWRRATGVNIRSGSYTWLLPSDAEAILRECPTVSMVSPQVQASNMQIVFGSANWVPAQMYGVAPEFFAIRDWQLEEGRFFTQREVDINARVCLVGQTVVNEVFNGASPLDSEIRIRDVTFRVIGVLKSKGANMMGSDEDDVVIMPWTTTRMRITGRRTGSITGTTSTLAQKPGEVYPVKGVAFYPEQDSNLITDTLVQPRFTYIDHIVFSATDPNLIDKARLEVTELLRERHGLSSSQEDDFRIRSASDFLRMMNSTSKLMSNLLLGVAIISLIVGGIGIMNIMLVSVTERTREIGLRMAVGARSRDILQQFLIEAVVLCLVGGILGILLGHGAALLVESQLNWPIGSSPTAVAAAFIVSVSIGIIFGFYPAWKASKLDPIEALRYE